MERCVALQRQVDEVQERLFAKNEALSRLQMAALGTVLKRPRDGAQRDELERMRLHHVDIKKAMRDFLKQVGEGEDVNYQAGVAYVDVRCPFIHPTDKETASMMDEAFEAAFLEEGGDMGDEARKKQIKQELEDYGLTQDELRGMGLVQLEAMLKRSRDLTKPFLSVLTYLTV